jgi:outer membrane protein TolC
MSVSRSATEGRRLSTAVVGWLMAAALVGPGVAQESTAVAEPAAPAQRVVSLRECIDLALTDSPTLMITEQQREIAAKGVTGAWGAFMPTVSVGYDYRKSIRTDFDVEQTSSVSYGVPTTDPDVILQFQSSVPNGEFEDETINSKSKALSGSATLNVFDGFAKHGNLSSAKRNLEAAEATVGYTRERVVESVVAAYFNLVRYEELAAVARETRDQAAKELERTETYFKLGSAAKSDVLQQRVRLENTKLGVVVADNSIEQGKAELAYAVNRPLAAEFAVDRAVLQTDFAVEDVAALYEEALGNRLDLQSSEKSVEARKQDVKAAKGGFYPRLDIFGSYGRSNDESPYKFGAQESEATSFGYSVSWNLFDRLQTYTNVGQAKAGARIADYQMQQARLNVQVEIRQLHNALVEARERASLSRETIVQAEEALRLAQERFRVGAGTSLDVIVAQVALADARSLEVQAKCDFLIAKASLDRALGRRSSVEEG